MTKIVEQNYDNCDNDCGIPIPNMDALESLEEIEVENENSFQSFSSPLASPFVDYESREILINGEINDKTIKNYVLPIIHFNLADENLGIEPEGRQPIIIYNNCYGGDIFAGFSLIDVIEASRTPVVCITLSYAFSMGFLISLACHKRYCYKHTTFLIHDGEMNLSNASSKVKTLYNYLIHQEKIVKDYIVSHTNISSKMLDKKFESDWYINAEEALQYGIVDNILVNNI